MGFFFGTKPKLKDYQLYDKGQQNVLGQLSSMSSDQLPLIFQYINQIMNDDPELMAQFEGPAKEQFQSETIPSILEAFGGAGAFSSSALNQTLGQAGRGLSRDLAAQRANLKQGASSLLNQYLESGLRQKKQPYIQGGTKGLFGNLAEMGGGQLFGNLMSMGNPLSAIQNLFQGSRAGGIPYTR